MRRARPKAAGRANASRNPRIETSLAAGRIRAVDRERRATAAARAAGDRVCRALERGQVDARSTCSPTARRLAFASKTPGRTQQINFFRLRSGALARRPSRATATPRCRSRLKRHWQGFLGRYVATRQSLVGLVLIVDARHGLARPGRRAAAEAILGSGRPGAAARDEDGQAHRIAAARRRSGTSAKRSPPRFPRTPRRSQSCPSRRRGASASRPPKPCWARGSRKETPAVHDEASRARPKKRPREQGECRGARNARRGVEHREGTRSGREAGDVAVRMDRLSAIERSSRGFARQEILDRSVELRLTLRGT